MAVQGLADVEYDERIALDTDLRTNLVFELTRVLDRAVELDPRNARLLANLATALLRYGPPYIKKLLEEVERWLEEHEYVSVEQMKGSMSHKSVPEPAAFERANYMKVLNSYV